MGVVPPFGSVAVKDMNHNRICSKCNEKTTGKFYPKSGNLCERCFRETICRSCNKDCNGERFYPRPRLCRVCYEKRRLLSHLSDVNTKCIKCGNSDLKKFYRTLSLCGACYLALLRLKIGKRTIICVKCGPVESTRRSRGLCERCYSGEIRNRNKRKAICEECGEKKNFFSSKEKICSSCKTGKYRKTSAYLEYRTKNKKIIRERASAYAKTHKAERCCTQNKRKANKLNATPKWADLEKIKQIYKDRPQGYVVDHVVPLKSKNVCGLNVPWNLQYLTPEENSSKHNKFDGTNQNESWRKTIFDA